MESTIAVPIKLLAENACSWILFVKKLFHYLSQINLLYLVMLNPTALLLMPLLAALLVMPAESDSACPAGMTPVGAQPWCVKRYDNEKTFCDAVKTCHENGQEMISKPVYDAMKATGSFSATRWWVGLVDALNERDDHKDGWVWIKDGQVTKIVENDFDGGEPNDSSNQDCVTTAGSNNYRLRDEGCDKTKIFYCYSDIPAANSTTAELSHRMFELTKIQNHKQPDPGCWIKEPSVRTLNYCILTCHHFQFGDCVGFYWHPVRRQCVLLPYFDASVPLDDSDFSDSEQEKLQWIKYRRMEW